MRGYINNISLCAYIYKYRLYIKDTCILKRCTECMYIYLCIFCLISDIWGVFGMVIRHELTNNCTVLIT
jgi:hypothetical protein